MIVQADKPICAAFKGNTYYLDLGSPSEPISLSPINTVNKFCVDKDDDGESPYFVIYVTDDCNMKCSYCFNAIDKNMQIYNREPLYNVEDFKNFIHRNYKEKEIGIRFFGGEPLINKKWIYSFVEEMAQEDIRINYDIFTNATLLDEEFINFAEKYHIRFYVSVNGGNDIFKGKYYKEKIGEGIKNLRKRGFPVIARMVWQPNTQETLVDLIRQTAEKGVKSISITLPWGMEYDDHTFSCQLEDFADFYLQNLADHNFRYIGVAPFINYISKWIGGESYNASFCAAGKSMVSIATDGSCYPCHCFVNIKEYCAGSIYDNVQPLFSGLNADTMKPCKACEIKYFCKAKCAADGYFANKDPYSMCTDKCKAEYQMIGASAYILYELQQRKVEYMAFRNLLKRVEGQYSNV